MNRSPLGYEQYDEVIITRQVVIGGKNKYLINGANVQVSCLLWMRVFHKQQSVRPTASRTFSAQSN